MPIDRNWLGQISCFIYSCQGIIAAVHDDDVDDLNLGYLERSHRKAESGDQSTG